MPTETPNRRPDGRLISAEDRNWASVRTILDALILAGIVWIVSSQLDSKVQSATLIAQVAAIQANISDVPALREKLTHVETVQGELLRRQAADDVIHQRLEIPGSGRH